MKKPALNQRLIDSKGTVWLIDFFSDDDIDSETGERDPIYFSCEVVPLDASGNKIESRRLALEDPGEFAVFIAQKGVASW